MGSRRRYRAHSKSTLLRAMESFVVENQALTAESRRWRRRLVVSVALAFLAGLGLGMVALRVLPP
jgi:hypothetical protein